MWPISQLVVSRRARRQFSIVGAATSLVSSTARAAPSASAWINASSRPSSRHGLGAAATS